jgi:hypothetical protein
LRNQQYYTAASGSLEHISPSSNDGGLFGAMKTAEALRKHFGESDAAQSPIWLRPSLRKTAKSPGTFKQHTAALRHMAERNAFLAIAENLFSAEKRVLGVSKRKSPSSGLRRRNSRRATNFVIASNTNKTSKALALSGCRRALNLTDEWSMCLANIRSGNDHMSVKIAAVSFVTGFLLACSAFLPLLSNHTLRHEVLESWRTIGQNSDRYANAAPDRSTRVMQPGKNLVVPATRLSYKQKIDS